MGKNCAHCMKKICKISGAEFKISEKDLAYYKKIGVSEPTLCSEERVRRRMAIRNERNLYKRKSDFSGISLISMYHPDSPFPIYSKEEWLSDKWDPMKYGQEINFGHSFFEQFHELQKVVPRANLAVFANTENADFCNYVGDAKNCYLCFGSIFIEDCMYGNPYYSKNCVDCFLVRKSELCYECIDSEELYHCIYLQDCYQCNDCFFGFDLKSCRNCIGCVGLRKKQYYIFNKQYSKEDYEKFSQSFDFCDKEKVDMVQKKLKELKLNFPHLAAVILNSENVTGNYIFNSKNCFNCFQISDNEDCSYNIQTTTSKDCYDMNYTEENELCYEYLGNYRNYKAIFSAICYGSREVYYCDYVTNCKNCFGCVALKNKEYCIFNKQYTETGYKELLPRLIKLMQDHDEWGEFFPIKYSPFAYNESVAYDYFPLNKEEALGRGYRWRDDNKAEFKNSEFVPPKKIEDAKDSICAEILVCEVSGRNYKIMPAELKFYRQMKLPIPRRHFIERHKARLAKRLPYKIFERKCSLCGDEIKTSYSLEREEQIYCENCYLKNVY